MASTETVSRASPFLSPLQGNIFENVLRRGRRQSRRPQTFFPGQTFVDPSQATRSGLRQMSRTARGGSPEINAALGNVTDTLGGQFVGGGPGAETLNQVGRGDFLQPGTNPFLRDTFDQSIAPAIRENVNSQMQGAGAFGSAANTRVLADSLGDAANQFFGENFARERGLQMNALGTQQQAFNQERQRQLGAAAAAPGLFQSRFAPAERLLGVGEAREDISSLPLQEQIQRHNFGQAEPGNRLRELLGIASGTPTGTNTTTTSPLFRNRATGALGGALVGGALGRGLFPGGGTIPGLVGGGLLGAFL